MKLLVIDLESHTEYVTEGLVLSQPANGVVTAITGPCCPVVRCKFPSPHRPHFYQDGTREGRCSGGGC